MDKCSWKWVLLHAHSFTCIDSIASYKVRKSHRPVTCIAINCVCSNKKKQDTFDQVSLKGQCSQNPSCRRTRSERVTKTCSNSTSDTQSSSRLDDNHLQTAVGRRFHCDPSSSGRGRERLYTRSRLEFVSDGHQIEYLTPPTFHRCACA